MKSLIGKEWKDAKDGSIIEVRNPATNELIDTVPSLSVEEVNEAVQYAKVAQKDWAKVPVHERCSILMKFVSLVERDKESLAKTLSDETGKPIKEAYNEINNISIGVPAYVERVKHDYGNLIPRGTEKDKKILFNILFKNHLEYVLLLYHLIFHVIFLLIKYHQLY